MRYLSSQQALEKLTERFPINRAVSYPAIGVGLMGIALTILGYGLSEQNARRALGAHLVGGLTLLGGLEVARKRSPGSERRYINALEELEHRLSIDFVLLNGVEVSGSQIKKDSSGHRIELEARFKNQPLQCVGYRKRFVDAFRDAPRSGRALYVIGVLENPSRLLIKDYGGLPGFGDALQSASL